MWKNWPYSRHLQEHVTPEPAAFFQKFGKPIIGAFQLLTVNKANQDDINAIERVDLINFIFQTHSGWSVSAESLPDSIANINLLPLNKANLI